jgi:hypothetical protein
MLSIEEGLGHGALQPAAECGVRVVERVRLVLLHHRLLVSAHGTSQARVASWRLMPFLQVHQFIKLRIILCQVNKLEFLNFS